MAYPTKEAKGFYTALFWAIFNSGAVVGGAITLGVNYGGGGGDAGAAGVSSTTFVAFVGARPTAAPRPSLGRSYGRSQDRRPRAGRFHSGSTPVSWAGRGVRPRLADGACSETRLSAAAAE
jgi:hypothetical protein